MYPICSYLFSQNPNAKITKKATKGLTREITDIEKAVEGKTAFEAIEYIAKNGKNKPRRIIAKKVAAKIKELEENGFVFDFEVQCFLVLFFLSFLILFV